VGFRYDVVALPTDRQSEFGIVLNDNSWLNKTVGMFDMPITSWTTVDSDGYGA